MQKITNKHKIETQRERSEKMNRLMPMDLKLYKIENLHKDVNITLKLKRKLNNEMRKIKMSYTNSYQ
jgi:hypothetical protein